MNSTNVDSVGFLPQQEYGFGPKARNVEKLFHFEISSVFKGNAPKNEGCFCFACYTGLSYIDVKLLCDDNILRGMD